MCNRKDGWSRSGADSLGYSMDAVHVPSAQVRVVLCCYDESFGIPKTKKTTQRIKIWSILIRGDWQSFLHLDFFATFTYCPTGAGCCEFPGTGLCLGRPRRWHIEHRGSLWFGQRELVRAGAHEWSLADLAEFHEDLVGRYSVAFQESTTV